MNNEVLVKVENVSKKFCRDLKRSLWYGIKDIAGELTIRNKSKFYLRTKEFCVLNDVSFELRRGECLGLIGRNGAGKTTLLRLINGLIKPDMGCITLRGRIGALIALGAGFNPILTGKENIYVNASVLGISKKEIDSSIDEIIEFADLEEFIDTPVQSYSSGMTVRLGFAIATALKPDTLLLDEVLAVGDFGFQTKCLSRLNSLKRSGGASILVTHNMPYMVQYADRCIWLEQGNIMESGDTGKVCRKYVQFVQDKANIAEQEDAKSDGDLFGGTFTTGQDIYEINVDMASATEGSVRNISSFEPLWVDFSFSTRREGPLGVTFKIHRQNGDLLSMMNNLLDKVNIRAINGRVEGRLHIDSLRLMPGNYVLVLVIQEGVEYLYRALAIRFNVTRQGQLNDLYSHGVMQMPHKWEDMQHGSLLYEKEQNIC